VHPPDRGAAPAERAAAERGRAAAEAGRHGQQVGRERRRAGRQGRTSRLATPRRELPPVGGLEPQRFRSGVDDWRPDGMGHDRAQPGRGWSGALLRVDRPCRAPPCRRPDHLASLLVPSDCRDRDGLRQARLTYGNVVSGMRPDADLPLIRHRGHVTKWVDTDSRLGPGSRHVLWRDPRTRLNHVTPVPIPSLAPHPSSWSPAGSCMRRLKSRLSRLSLLKLLG